MNDHILSSFVIQWTPDEVKLRRLQRPVAAEEKILKQDLALIGDGLPRNDGKHNKSQVLRMRKYRRQGNRKKKAAEKRAAHKEVSDENDLQIPD